MPSGGQGSAFNLPAGGQGSPFTIPAGGQGSAFTVPRNPDPNSRILGRINHIWLSLGKVSTLQCGWDNPSLSSPIDLEFGVCVGRDTFV